MSRWFRLYDDLVDDPKVQRLPAETFRGLINLWCLASKNDGVLPLHDEIAFKLRLTGAKATKLLDDLMAAGLLTHDETGVRPHNWDRRQHKGDVSNERVKRFRDKRRNAACNVTRAVSVTPPDTDTETDSSEASASGASAPPDPAIAERELFARGKTILGASAGGLISKLLRSKGGNVALARSAIEQASQAHNPAEFIGRCLHPHRPEKPRGRTALEVANDLASRFAEEDAPSGRLLS